MHTETRQSSARRPAGNSLAVLGSRGIPARYGGFETFAERLALYLVERRRDVTVYCQDDEGERIRESLWNGVRLIHIPAPGPDPLSSVVFDWRATRHASSRFSRTLTLGYNTAIFCCWLRARRVRNVINMDGIEWKRAKWSAVAKAWLYVNEYVGCLIGDELVADHKEIGRRLARYAPSRRIHVIPYGADAVLDADPAPLARFDLEAGRYALVVARGEPENSIREIVDAFSAKRRGMPLVVVGAYDPENNPYHRTVIERRGAEVMFIGPIYEADRLNALRFHCKLYIHGHRIGGTNPSLVEALGCGSPVLAQDNPFNRWVAGPGAHYFTDRDSCAMALDGLLARDDLSAMSTASRERHSEDFQWQDILGAYERLLFPGPVSNA